MIIFDNKYIHIITFAYTMHNVSRWFGLHRAKWRRLGEKRAPASVGQWSEYLLRKQKVRGSSSPRVTPCRFFIELTSIYLFSCEHSLITILRCTLISIFILIPLFLKVFFHLRSRVKTWKRALLKLNGSFLHPTLTHDS